MSWRTSTLEVRNQAGVINMKKLLLLLLFIFPTISYSNFYDGIWKVTDVVGVVTKLGKSLAERDSL